VAQHAATKYENGRGDHSDANPDDEETLLRNCVAAHPGYAWCLHALSSYYREKKQWAAALDLANKAAAVLPATDITENQQYLSSAGAGAYTTWSGTRSTAVLFTWLETVWSFVLGEKGKGFACPVLCRDPTRFATLCYDASWERRGDEDIVYANNFYFWLDDGSRISATLTAPDGTTLSDRRRGETGSAVATICVPLQRSVESFKYQDPKYCDGGEF
jgi:hypothetical protein